MKAEQRACLDAAYRASTYFVDGPAGRFALRVGQASAELDALAAAHKVITWAYVTAYNPGSIALPREQNEQRQRGLKKIVAEAGYPFYNGEGKGDADWPAEPSLLVLGISQADAAALAHKFGQAAVLFGERGGHARLMWMGDERPESWLNKGNTITKTRKDENTKGSMMGHQFEELSSRILGAAVDVHKALGPGFLESIYQKAMEVALEHRGIPYQQQKEVCVFFDCTFRDFPTINRP
jgi:hypothetical protein